jgi:hypothetical protein
LTADQFDEVEIREVSCFGAVPMKSGIPAAEHTPPKRNRQAHFMELSFHLLLRNSHGLTHSYGCAAKIPGSASQQNRPLDFRFGSDPVF